jgi:signal transduction histidine kinase/CheY-like chemotaxis protein
MSNILQFWRKLKDNGCDAYTDPIDLKNIIFTNTLLYISFCSYCVFFLSVFFSKILPTNLLLLSSFIIIVGFILVYFLMRGKHFLIAKSILLLLIYLAIFFYDFNLGESVGVYLYYFAFFFATVNIFSWKKEKALLLVFLCIPAILLLSTELYNLIKNKADLHKDTVSLFIYVFNSFMTFFIIAINALLIIKENLITQQSLKLSQLNAQSLIDNTQGYIWSIDMNYKLVAFSKSYKDIIKKHYNIDCYEGLDIKKIFELPNNPEEIPLVYKQVLMGKTPTAEYFSNNNYFELQGSPLYNTSGEQIGGTFHSRLITNRKTREQELQQSKINLETLIDTVGNSTWSLTKDYKIIAANKMYISDMKRIFNIDIHPGYDVSQLFDKPNYPADWRGQYDTVFSGQNLYLDYIFNDEYFELNAVPIKSINNEIVGAVFFSRNITDRKIIEQELTSAKINAEQATTAKAQFLSNMSHELRTPLNGIIGLTNILIGEAYLPTQANHLEVLKYSSDHMLILINDILDFNKIEAGKVILEEEDFSMMEMLQKIHSFFSLEAANKNILFTLKAPEELNRNMLGDVTRLRQVLTNLINNAIKFTEKGSVIFAIDILEKTSEKSCILRFIISDTGIGIEHDKIEQIFESFGQADPSTIRKYGGSGLGLTISKKLIELMGATLKVESEVGKGSKFWFDIEMNCSVVNTNFIEQEKVIKIYDLENVHILVVEDNAVNMMVVTKMLEKWNARISKAANGEEAISLEASNNYDIILMDLQMPIMDGFTATAIIRERNKIVPIIALTATTDESLIGKTKSTGMNGIVQKPFVPEILYDKIKTTVTSI